MKKLLILLAVILFGVSVSFAQVYKVQVNWDYTECDCEGTIQSFFKVSISIHDDANNEDVIKDGDAIYFTEDAEPDNLTTPELTAVEDYCNDEHEYTPSFTIYATVWLECNDTNPPTEVCSGQGNNTNVTCHDFLQWYCSG
jgi:hypothetical protein